MRDLVVQAMNVKVGFVVSDCLMLGYLIEGQLSGGQIKGITFVNNLRMAKFDWVPYLEGKYLNYYQWFAAIGSFVLLCLATLFFIAYLIICKFYHERSKHPWLSGDKKKFIDWLKNFTFNGTFVCITIIPLICSALDVLYLVEGIIGMMAVQALQIYLNNGRKKWDEEVAFNMHLSTFKTYISLCLKLSPESIKALKRAAIISVVFPCLMYRTCLCFYNDEVGYYNGLLGFGVNTYLSRIFQLKDSCPSGAPCHMYATIPEDPSYAFFLNLHTHPDVSNVIVYYQELNTQDPTAFLNVTAETYDYKGLEWKAARKVHSALIMGLKPDTKYLTKVFYNNQFWTNAIYRTLPANNSRPIRMINGGDSGYTHAAVNLSRIASTLQPDIFIIGGDIAYDDNMPACAYTWDYFLGMYGRLTATLGYLMPIVSVVGNHDVGLNELPGINITINNYGPAYFIYFPQHYDRNLDGHVIKRVPPLNHRRTLLEFSFANVLYLGLDSGYLHHFEGFQKDFMINSFENNKNKFKFVGYHVPIYSVCEAFDRSPERYLYALFHWVPNFDKYKVMTVFENHVHAFKRTKPLIGNTPRENGTVYVGDGAYGAIIGEMCTPDITIDIFDAWDKSNNMWLSEIYENRVEHTAYNSHGKIIDNYTQYWDSYKL